LGGTITPPGIGIVEPAGAHNPGKRARIFDRPLEFNTTGPDVCPGTFAIKMIEIAKDEPGPGGRISATFSRDSGRCRIDVVSKGWISRIARSFEFPERGRASLLRAIAEVSTRFDQNKAKEERKMDWSFRFGNGIRAYKFLGLFPFDGEDAHFEVFRVETKRGPFLFLSDKMNPIFLPRKAMDRMAESVREPGEGGNSE